MEGGFAGVGLVEEDVVRIESSVHADSSKSSLGTCFRRTASTFSQFR